MAHSFKPVKAGAQLVSQPPGARSCVRLFSAGDGSACA